MSASPEYRPGDEAPHPVEFISFQVIVLGAAVKALIKTHPHPEALRAEFDQAVAEIQTNPMFLRATLEQKALLRKMAEDLFG